MQRHPSQPEFNFVKLITLLAFAGLVGKATPLAAQCLSVPRNPLDAQGGFTVSVSRGCAPLKVDVTSEDPNVTSTTYLYNMVGTDYKKYSGRLTNRKDTTYTRPGKYTIIQLGSKNGTASFACQEIEVLPTAKPTNFRQFSCQLNQVTITLLNDPAFKFDTYEFIPDVSQPNVGVRQLQPGDNVITYPNSLPRNARIVGVYAGLCRVESDPFQVNPAGPDPNRPVITRLEVTGPSTARLDYRTVLPGSAIDIFQKTGGGAETKIASTAGGTFINVQNLTNATTQYCFVIKNAAGNCARQPLQSDELCTIPLTVTAENKQNQVQWTAHPAPGTGLSFRDYVVAKNGQPFRTFTTRATSQLTDTEVECGRDYSYAVTARVGDMISISRPLSVTALNNTPPPTITDVYASVVNGKVELNWLLPAGSPISKLFTVSRSSTISPAFQLVGTTQANRFTDDVNPANGPYCYSISYQDLCSNNATSSQPVCSVALTQQSGTLSWTTPLPFLEALQGYSIRLLDEQGNPTGAPINVGNQTSYTLDLTSATTQQVRYQVTARSARGVSSFSNIVSLSLAMRLYVPDAFSPNGDGLNDRFTAQGLFLQTFRMTVFNRWGAPVFRTDSADEGWDGTFNGQPLEQGTYVYAIDVSDFRGETFTKRGSFLLLR